MLLQKKWEMITVPGALSVVILASVGWLDLQVVLNASGFRPATPSAWVAFSLINIGLVSLTIFTMALILPSFFVVCTETGIQWLSLTGRKSMHWPDVICVDDRHTFWRARKLILKSSQERLVISPQIFATEEEIIHELRRHLPQELWIKTGHHPK